MHLYSIWIEITTAICAVDLYIFCAYERVVHNDELTPALWVCICSMTMKLLIFCVFEIYVLANSLSMQGVVERTGSSISSSCTSNVFVFRFK